MLSVFGPELGPVIQAQCALLILLICIVCEIYGKTSLATHNAKLNVYRFPQSSMLPLSVSYMSSSFCVSALVFYTLHVLSRFALLQVTRMP